MNEKEQYQQKMQAQLDEIKAELEILKQKAVEADKDTQPKINKHIKELEAKIDDTKSNLGKLRDASGDAWDAVKDGVESSWQSLKSGVKEAVSKFK